MKRKKHILLLSMLLPCFVLWIFNCGPNKNHVSKNYPDGSICAVLAHPDDETIISGTLAKLADMGFDITVVYVTSGDDGPDETGRGLHGAPLAEVREKEATQALQAIGIKSPPVFLRFPDSHVPDYTEAVQRVLYNLFNEMTPEVVIGFGPDGITDDWDHRMTGLATDFAFDLTDSSRLLLHMAITSTSSPFFAMGLSVSKQAVNFRVNVTQYADQRTHALQAHRTQFNSKIRSMYKALVLTMPTEAFIIARNRDAGQWLEKCFDVQDEDASHNEMTNNKYQNPNVK